MQIITINELSKFIDTYVADLFKRVDDELKPEVYLVSFDLSNQMINMRHQNEVLNFQSDVNSIDVLFDRRNELSDLVQHYVNASFHEHSTVYHSDFFLSQSKIYVYALCFEHRALSSYYHLPESLNLMPTSLVESIILELLKYINTMTNSFLLSDEFDKISANMLLKTAGKSFLLTIIDITQSENPFDLINKISSLSYEKSFSKGKILLLPENQIEYWANHGLYSIHILFHEPIPLKNYRHIRKILELSKKDIYLLSDGSNIYCTVKLKDIAEIKSHQFNIFTIEFNNYFSWQFNYNFNKLMQVTQEDVFIPKPKISYFKFSSEFKKVFESVEAKQMLALYKLILESIKQPKGTIIVISKNAKSEAYRLKNQGFIIESTLLHPTMMRSITSIDGAVLMDLSGYCYGIGVILDGIATDKGDASRGARYNSAIRYVETISNNPNYSDCFCVIISEDGDVDLVSKCTITNA